MPALAGPQQCLLFQLHIKRDSCMQVIAIHFSSVIIYDSLGFAVAKLCAFVWQHLFTPNLHDDGSVRGSSIFE